MTEPTTIQPQPTGTDASRYNALRHGLRSEETIIGSEVPDEWEAYQHAIVLSKHPADFFEVELAGRAAELMWRLKRVPRAIATQTDYESERDAELARRAAKARRARIIEDGGSPSVEDPGDESVPVRTLPDLERLRYIHREEAHMNRQLMHVLHELEAVQDRRLGRHPNLNRVDVHGLPS